MASGAVYDDFNTSYVTVQLSYFVFLKMARFISIHPMLRFNLISPEGAKRFYAFQYILCYGSTIGVM